MKQENKPEIKQELTQELSHELSMKLMFTGQSIIEIESSYMHCLSRHMQDKIHEAVKLLEETAKECMNDMYIERMHNWEQEKPDLGFTRKKDAWETMNVEQEAAWKKRVGYLCRQGFTNVLGGK